MTSNELRRKFLDFFAEKGHIIVPSSSLLPTDPSVLFTTAGMQQFKQYFLGEKSSYGNKVASCQKCFRTSDIEVVGDASHLTFLEMLGNFSFGGYFKKEAIKFAYDFLFKELKLPFGDAVFTMFEGDQDIPEDKESAEIWKKLGIPENKIKKCGREENFWGPTGKEGPCGPTTEIHIKEIEVWNLVFNEYYQDPQGELTPLQQRGVDTGMGLERLAMIVQGKSSVFETDLFQSFFPKMEKPQRIISDHIKGAVFLAAEGIFPSNVEQGYALRRILRRAIRFGKLLDLPKPSTRAKLGAGLVPHRNEVSGAGNFLIPLAQKVIEIYKDIYPEVKSKEEEILTVIQNEEEKFEKTLNLGLKQFEKISAQGDISGEAAFHLFDTYGFPLELTQELAKERGLRVDIKGFEEAFGKHREISRAGVEKKFGPLSPKLHTATHLLHAALRQVLGGHVKQMGSDITPQRLRFDFAHPQKMTGEELKKAEDLVNQKIKEDLEVKKEQMSYEEALKSEALAFFKEKYPEKVTVYSIGPSAGSGQGFSKEICAGPHANRTSELGHFKIIKEESSGAGVRRIRAISE